MLDFLGNLAGGIFGMINANKQMDMQKKFAKKQIQWRAADARAAGIHPLAALGASGAQYQPVHNPMGDAIAAGMSSLSQMGQKQLEAEGAKAQIDATRAQAELFRAQSRTEIANARNAAIGGAAVRTKLTHPEGSPENPIPSTISVLTEDGKKIAFPNPKLFGDFSEMGGYSAALGWGRARGAVGPQDPKSGSDFVGPMSP